MSIMTVALRSSPSALAVLSLLRAGPMHPYGMQRLIKLWGKDQVVNVGQRANLYKTIKRLHEAGLIEVRQTERDQQYPERTVYALTAAGHRVGLRWLADMLAVPRNEYPEFPAALSFAMLLEPAELADALQARLAGVRERLAPLERDLAAYAGDLPRITLLDDEYRHAVLAAEASWLAGLIADLRDGRLTWSEEMLAAYAERYS
jgi:DNA-binding PadR family transcriptional regulator